MKKLTPETTWESRWTMAVAAVRYCLDRRTYIVPDCQEWLYEIWDKLPEKAKAIIRCDIEGAFRRDDEDRANGKDYRARALGSDCDRRSWEKVRKLWRNEGASACEKA